MEKMFCLMDGKTDTKFSCVRYGNVAWSTGSVLPVWKDMWEKNKLITTTGPEMRRFFFTVNEAVDLVIAAIDLEDHIHGKILSREMKSAQIGDILRVWVSKWGGKYESGVPRPGDRLDEYLINESEIPFCEEILINNIKHYIISPNEKSTNPIKTTVHSGNVARLTDEEIIKLLESQTDYL
jgi:FlaA1/EpsC-like NDP-sugar epimerase